MSAESLPKVTMSSTKKAMLDAYKAAKKLLEEKAANELNPEQKVEEKKKKDVVVQAERIVNEGVAKKISDLRVEVGAMLTELGEKLEDATGRYSRLQEAIEIKDKEFSEIFEIDRSARSLASLIEAHKQKEEELTGQSTKLKSELEEEISSARKTWEAEKKLHADALKEQQVEEKKQREREMEEYKYQFEREKEQAENKLGDEIKQIEKDIVIKKESFQKEAAEKERGLAEREKALQEKENLLAALEKKVQDFPKELEANVKKAVDGVSERLKQEARHQEVLMQKEFLGENNVLKTKIEALERTVNEQSKQIVQLTQKLEGAYGKVQDIAVKTVEGAAQSKAFRQLPPYSDKERNTQQDQSRS